MVEKDIILLRMESLTVDPLASEEPPAHKTLLTQNILILEGVLLQETE